jgi:flagellin-like hook-associated protein FlgL
MVINTNMTGAASPAMTGAVDRPASKVKSNNSTPQSSVPSWNTLSAQVNDTVSQGGLDFSDVNAASQSAKVARSAFLGQPATAMLAQANFSPEMVMSLLKE